MKARGLILVDFECGNFEEAAEAEKMLRDMVTEIKKRSTATVVYADSDVKERRGDKRPNLKTARLLA